MAYTVERLPDLPIAGRDGANLFLFDSGTGSKLHIRNGWSITDPVNFSSTTTSELIRIDDPETGKTTQILGQHAPERAPRHTGGHAVDSAGGVHDFGADVQLGKYDEKHWLQRNLSGNVIDRLTTEGQIGRRVLAMSGTLGDHILFAGGEEFPNYMGPETTAALHTDVMGFDTAAFYTALAANTAPPAWTTLEADCDALPRSAAGRMPQLSGNAYIYGGAAGFTGDELATIYRSTGADFGAGLVLLATDSRFARKYSTNAQFNGRLWQIGGTIDNVNTAGIYHFAADGTGITELADHGIPAHHAGDGEIGPDGHLYLILGSANVGAEDAMVVSNQLWRIVVS